MDVVYVVRASTDNEQLRYSLRSVAANLPHDKVWVAGFTPSFLRGVRSVPVANGATKWDGSTRNLAAAVRERFLSRTFVMFNDDFYVTEPIDAVPTLHRGALADVVAFDRYTVSRYATAMRDTLAMLRSDGVDEPQSYELHTPMVLDKAHTRELLDSIPKLDPRAELAMQAHKRTFYGNRYGIGGERIDDVKVYDPRSKLPSGPFASTCNTSFNGRAGKELRALFPDPCKYERS